MVVDAATAVLTNISIILLVGLLLSMVSNKLGVSNVLLLIITGVILGNLGFQGQPIMEFSGVFLVSMAVLTLVMVVFDGASRFDLKMVNLYSVAAFKVTLYFILFNILLLTPFTLFLFFNHFNATAVLFAMLFAILMSGTDPGSVILMLKNKTNKVIEFLEVEAIINTPIMVILPFIILDLIVIGQGNFTSAVVGQILPFLQQIIVGVGAGMVIGVIVFKSMKKVYSERLSPVGLITAALLSYIIAENLSGNGVLAVATLGLFFGNIYVKEKNMLQEFNSMLSNGLVLLVFILLGLIIKIDFSFWLIAKSLLLFLILVISRLAAISHGLRKTDFNLKEKIFMAINMPKGIAVAVVAFSLSVFPFDQNFLPYRQIILEISILTMIYSLIFASILNLFSQRFIRVKLSDK